MMTEDQTNGVEIEIENLVGIVAEEIVVIEGGIMVVGAGIGTGIMSEIMDTMGAMREIMSAHVVMIQEVVAGHLLGLGNIPGITIGTGMIDTWMDMELMFFRSVVKSCRIGINYVPVLMLLVEFGSFYFFCWMYLLLQRLSWLIFVRDALYNQKMEQVFVKHRYTKKFGDWTQSVIASNWLCIKFQWVIA